MYGETNERQLYWEIDLIHEKHQDLSTALCNIRFVHCTTCFLFGPGSVFTNHTQKHSSSFSPRFANWKVT